MAEFEDLKSWMVRDLGRFAGDWESFTHNEGGHCCPVTSGHSFSVYTDKNVYRITASFDSGGRGTYLGCTATSRKARAGEAGPRGRDLSDGAFSEDTWRRIMADIVGFELVRVRKSVEGSPGVHASDCALHSGPAFAPGPCDCGAGNRPNSLAKPDESSKVSLPT